MRVFKTLRFTTAFIFLISAFSLIVTTGCHRNPDRISKAKTVINTALSVEGTPYRYGGKNPSGFDCSGLVFYCYQQAGIHLPAMTELLRKKGNKVARSYKPSKLKPGDLLFFRIDKWLGKPNHVGVYIGHDRMIHASTTQGVTTVSLNNPYWEDHFTYARRIIR